MNICNFLFAQDNANLKKWQEIECENIDKINCQCMWECETGDTKYILSQDPDDYRMDVYKIIANEKELKLESFNIIKNKWLSNSSKIYLKDEQYIFRIYYSSSFNGLILNLFDLTTSTLQKAYNELQTVYSTEKLAQCNFQFCMIDNTHYFLSNTDGLQQLELDDEGKIFIPHTCEGFSYASKENTSIVVLKDTLYYFSESGFVLPKFQVLKLKIN